MAGSFSNTSSEHPTGFKESKTEHLELGEKDVADNLHVHNEFAFKGDDSDGKVAWTLRHSLAAISLGMLYAG